MTETGEPQTPPVRRSKAIVIEPDQFRFIKRLPWEKITIWGVFLALIYMLQTFFSVLFLTFILSYISANLVHWSCRKIGIGDRPNHWLRYVITIGVFLAFLALLAGAGSVVFPELFAQGRKVAEQARHLIPRSPERVTPEGRADALLKGMMGEKEYEEFKETPKYYPLRMEIAKALRKVPGQEKPEESPSSIEAAFIPAFEPEQTPADSVAGPATTRPKDLLQHLDSILASVMGKDRFEELQRSQTYRETYSQILKSVRSGATDSLPAFADFLTKIVTRIAMYTLNFSLAILFSFMIVLGIPSFGKSIKAIEESRIGGFYMEISPSVVSFGRSMGMAFQGQAIIALMNTALTMIGLVLLGIPNPIALGVIVFVCSFVPVLGVFISSAPITLVALQESGVILAVEAVVLITVIHIIEAYILNPRVLGQIMHMHPLLVLVILFVGEHYFGIWGLLIGVPLCHYLFNHVILSKPVPGKSQTRTRHEGIAAGSGAISETGQPRNEPAGAAADGDRTSKSV